MEEVIAVLDVGKTNKKVALFDMQMRMRTTRKTRIDAIETDGLRVEDIVSIEEWFLDRLTELAREYDIRAVTTTTHGAASVCIGEDGTPVVPPVDYTQPVDEEVHHRFFQTMGDAWTLQKTTATAEVRPLINVGKALFFLRERYPERFSRIQHVLLYPQYFAWRLTGVATADITYVGCHSYLRDFGRNDWSAVVDRLGIRHALPTHPVLPTEPIGTISDAVASRTGLRPDVVVTAGIHDSNASLMPYLVSRERDFVLNSTGTWCVAMHPVEKVTFTPDELGRMVFFNLSYTGQPVKTSILLGGLEHETYREILSRIHGRDEEPALNVPLLTDILGAADTFILPSVVQGAGQFPDSAPRVVERDRTFPLEEIQAGRSVPTAFEDYERGLALVDISVAIQSVIAMRRVGLAPGMDVFIEGGFRNNRSYLAILSALLPENPISLTSVEEATCFGAALCARAALAGQPDKPSADTVRMEIQPVNPTTLPGIEEYREKLLTLVTK